MRRWAAPSLAALVCPALVALCYAVVDRPAAMLAHESFADYRPVFDLLTHLVDPVPPLATLGIVGAGVASLLGWQPRPGGRVLVACCLATLVAVMLKDQLEFVFGRLRPETWVQGNPSLIRDGAYGFFPFHGGPGWSSFPSGDTAMITAPIAVLWIWLPRWRPILALPVVLVTVGLFGADYHFVGDMVAGFYLGAACGVGAAVLLDCRPGTPFAPEP